MPKVQLIFIMHVSTYRSIFPFHVLPWWYLSCPKSCVWARNEHLMSCRFYVSSAVKKLCFLSGDIDGRLKTWVLEEPLLGQFWRQRLASVLPYQGLSADGFFCVGSLLGYRALRAEGACPHSGFCLAEQSHDTLTAKPPPFPHHLGSKTNSLLGSFFLLFV